MACYVGCSLFGRGEGEGVGGWRVGCMDVGIVLGEQTNSNFVALEVVN